MAGSERRIPLASVIRDAFVLPARHASELIRAAGLPLLVLIAITLAWEALPGSGWLMALLSYVVYSAAFCWLATTVHRLVLLDEASSSEHFTAAAWKRIGVYFLAFMFIAIVYLVAQTVLFNGIGIATGINYVQAGEQPKFEARRWLVWVTSGAALLLISRWVLVLPAIALDKGHELTESWRLARGNTLRLAVIFGVLPWMLSWIRTLLFRDGASAVEVAVLLVLGCLLAVVEITALSLSYAALSAPSPPPTDPRA